MLENAWQAGTFKGRAPELLFGQMFEDSAIELEAFQPKSRVFCIASAGCTARALAAAGHEVTAVDINPRQISYAQSRANGGPLREGAADRLLARARRLLTIAGWTESKRNRFLTLNDPKEQLEFWDRHLDSSLWRTGVDCVLSSWMLRLFYSAPFGNFPGHGFGARVRARLRRCWAKHPNRSNPYAWSLLLGCPAAQPGQAEHPIQFACADAASFLEACRPASFNAFSLSNVGDAAPVAYFRRLREAVERAACPGAVVVTRSFAEPPAITESNWASRDRSLLWGSVEVSHV